MGLIYGQPIDKKKMQKIKKMGLLDLLPRNKRGLTKEEIKQQTLLWKRNAMNNCILNEAYAIIDNARTVEKIQSYLPRILMPRWLILTAVTISTISRAIK